MVPENYLSDVPTNQEITLLAAMAIIYAAVSALPVHNAGNMLIAAWSMVFIFVSINCIMASKLVQSHNRDIEAFRTCTGEMIGKVGDNYLVVGSWNNLMRFELYEYGRVYTDKTILSERLTGKHQSETMIEKWQRTLEAGIDVWLLEEVSSLFQELHEAGYTIKRDGDLYYASRSIDHH